MSTEREARLQAELAKEADFLRRQELLKTLWRSAQHHDDPADRVEAQTGKAAAATGARAKQDEHSSPRVAV